MLAREKAFLVTHITNLVCSGICVQRLHCILAPGSPGTHLFVNDNYNVGVPRPAGLSGIDAS